MPNQYTKVPLKIITEIPKDNKVLSEIYTRELVKLLIPKLPRDPKLIDKIIKEIKDNVSFSK